jgi:hypothetical protein
VQAVNNTAENDRNKKKRIILSESTKKLIEQRELIKPFIHDSPRNRIEYSELNKLTKREIRKDLRDKISKKVKTIIEKSKSVKKIRK